MPVPIVKQRDHLIASIQSTLTDEDWIEMRGQLAELVRGSGARGVIIDVSSLDVLDSFAARMLRTIAQIVRLRGVDTVVVGIAPEVAYAMVQLGLSLEGVDAALDLDRGLELLQRRTRRHGDPG